MLGCSLIIEKNDDESSGMLLAAAAMDAPAMPRVMPWCCWNCFTPLTSHSVEYASVSKLAMNMSTATNCIPD